MSNSIRARLLNGASAIKAIMTGEDPKTGSVAAEDEGEDTTAVVTLTDAAQGAADARAEGHEAGLAAGTAEGIKQGTEAGRKAERDRCAAVFASDEGKANPAMGAWLLAENPDTKAEDIVAKLGTMPAPKPESAAERHERTMRTVPPITTGGQGAKDGGEGGDADPVAEGIARYNAAHGAPTVTAGGMPAPLRGS